MTSAAAILDAPDDTADRLGDAVDNISSAPAIAMLVLFIPGAFFGLLTMTVVLWRSRAVPRGAVAWIPVFIVRDLPLQRGVISHAVARVGACWIGWAVLRARPS